MIEERIEAGKKNIEWARRNFINRPDIEVERISRVIPVKERDGRYCFHVRYKRITRFKQTKIKRKRKNIYVQGYRSSEPKRRSQLWKVSNYEE